MLTLIVTADWQRAKAVANDLGLTITLWRWCSSGAQVTAAIDAGGKEGPGRVGKVVLVGAQPNVDRASWPEGVEAVRVDGTETDEIPAVKENPYLSEEAKTRLEAGAAPADPEPIAHEGLGRAPTDEGVDEQTRGLPPVAEGTAEAAGPVDMGGASPEGGAQ